MFLYHRLCFVCVSLQEREDAVQSSSVEELKAEVEELQEEKAELDCTQRRLDEEMETLNMHTAALTQMDILKKGKVMRNLNSLAAAFLLLLLIISLLSLLPSHLSSFCPPGRDGGADSSDPVSSL